MRVRLPKGTTRLSHAGKSVLVAADGTLEIGADAIPSLEPHGIAPAGDPPTDSSAGSPRRAPAKPAR